MQILKCFRLILTDGYKFDQNILDFKKNLTKFKIFSLLNNFFKFHNFAKKILIRYLRGILVAVSQP